MSRLGELVYLSYKSRACFVCGRFGWCAHREYRVEAAIVEHAHCFEEPKPPARAGEIEPAQPMHFRGAA